MSNGTTYGAPQPHPPARERTRTDAQTYSRTHGQVIVTWEFYAYHDLSDYNDQFIDLYIIINSNGRYIYVIQRCSFNILVNSKFPFLIYMRAIIEQILFINMK